MKKRKHIHTETDAEKDSEVTQALKRKLCEILGKCPIVQVACQRANVPKSTYYKWRLTDPEFKLMADYGIIEGRFVITDIAESKLLKKITSEENLTAIIFWLKHNHASYIPKFSVEVKSDNDNSHQLSHDQIKQVSKAMIRMGLGEALVPEQKQLGEEAIEEEKAGRKPEY